MTPPPDFIESVNRYLDGSITSQEMLALNASLRSDAALRRWFVEWVNLNAALDEQAVGWEAPAAPLQTAPRVRRSPRWMATVIAAAAMLALFLGATWWLADSGSITVTGAVGTSSFAVGKPLPKGPHEITSGSIELLTSKGAHLVIEAPATFEFASSQSLRLSRGRVAADVPPAAKGFTVVTPTGKAIDLGTRFGVDVPLLGQPEIHVFQGEVIAQSSGGGKKQSLREGQAYSLQKGAGSSRELRSAAFIRPAELSELGAALSAGQRERSEAALANLRADPALIALLDFETASLPEGTFRMVQGRWPGSKAPEFVQEGDHMKLAVGGDRVWPQLTLAAWVRLDRLGAPYQSLYHTDGWNEDRAGQVHWIINQNATMRLALKHNTLAPGSDERFGFPDSRTPVLPERGRWVHLAVVYDSVQKTVHFYLNGQLDKVTHQQIAHPARLGVARIGNWDEKDRKLSGRIDEILFMGRALSDQEIQSLYAAGNPYR